MARLQLELPDAYRFMCQQTVRVTDLNYANHLGNDAMISLLHEARCQFFCHLGFSEADVCGLGIMVTDLAATYKSECFAGDVLNFEVGICDFNKYGCDVIYRVTKGSCNTLVAEAKNGIVFFDYHLRKLALVPSEFKALFETN